MMRAWALGWLAATLLAGTAQAADSTASFPDPEGSTPPPPSNGPRSTLTDVSTPAAGQAESSESTPGPSTEGLELRNERLREYVGAYVRQANLAEGFGYAMATLNAVSLGVGATAWDSDRPAAAAWTIGFGASTLAVGASLFASRDTRVDVLRVLLSSSVGVYALGLAVAETADDFPRLSMASASGAYFLQAVFETVNAFARKSKLSTLRSARDRLDAGDVGAAELRTIERAYLGTDAPFTPRLLAAPLGIGGLIAFVPAFDDDYTKPQKTVAAVTGSLLSLYFVLTFVRPNHIASYKGNLDTLGLSLMASPTNLDLRYRF